MAYVDERLELFGRLRKLCSGRSLADALRLDARSLRFHVGTSLADMRVPVHLAPSLDETFRAAVRDLFFLLSTRHRAALRPDEYDRLILLDGFDPRAMRALSFTPPSAVSREGVRRAFAEGPELHPALDSGIVASWISTGRPGRVLVGVVHALLQRATREARSVSPEEPTPYLVLLALRALAARAHEAVRDLPVSGAMGRVFSGAVGAGALVALRLAMRESGVLEAPFSIGCEAAALCPPWLSGLRLFWGSGAAMYGLPLSDQPPRLELLVQKLVAGATAESVAREAVTDLSGNRELQARAGRLVVTAKLRETVLQLLRLVDAGRASALSGDGPTWAQLYQWPGVLERALAGAAARKDLLARLKSSQKGATNDLARSQLATLMELLEKWRDDEASDVVPAEQVARTWAIAVAGLAADLAIDSGLRQAEAQLSHRTGAENEGGIETQHEAGKLYLFAAGSDRPLLMQRARAPQMGHLFCDMKDFTKRTAFLKETVVADFLSREFYGPILTAAGRYAHGAAHLADKGGIYLNNLLGDAVSFSGDIVSLVELTHDIRRALESYARRLQNESSREQVARTISAIGEKYQARAEELAAALRTAEDAQRRGTLDPVSGEEPSHRIQAIRNAEQALREEKEAEIALATGEKLEAGIFLSYGAAPEVATFEDHVFGPIKVSIAEKINESARGTARSGAVRARIDALVQRARAATNRPELVFPFAVAVAQPIAMPIQGETEIALRASLSQGDVEGAETLLGATVRDFISSLAADELPSDRGDIYNGGAALSEDALNAYVEARRGDVKFVRRQTPVRALHHTLREKFVFPDETLRVVAGLAQGGLTELYVYAGRALFKGFEKQGGLAIYEMIPRESALFRLLAQHHAAAWAAETDDPSGEMVGLDGLQASG